MTNPGKFQLIILSKTNVNHSIEVINKKATSSKSLKLQGLNIGNKHIVPLTV